MKVIQAVQAYLIYIGLKWKLSIQAFFTVNFYRLIYPYRRMLLSIGTLFLIAILTRWAWHMLPAAFFVRSETATGYFIGLGAAVFGLIAIGFSLQSLVIQNTAENRSAGLYEIEGKDPVPTLIFAFLSFVSVGFFFLAVWANGVTASPRRVAIVGSIPALALVLWSLYILYRHTFTRMSPTKVIERVETRVRKDLRWMGKIARQNAIVVERKLKDPTVNRHIAEAAMFSRMQPRLQHASQRIEFLFDYHDKLVSTQEHYAAREVLDSVRQILLEYLAVRSGSSIRNPLGLFGASTSDSQDFLISTLEDLASRGKQYIHSTDDRGVTHVIGIFQDIVIASTNVKYVPPRRDDNPLFTQFRSYFGQIVDEAFTHEATEALYQSAKAYGKMGDAALDVGLSVEFHSIDKQLHRIGDFSGRRHELEAVWSACMHVVSSWINKLLSNSVYVNNVQFSLALETWIKLAVIGLRNGMRDSVLGGGTPLSMPLLIINSYVSQVFAKWEAAEGDEKRKLESTMLTVIERFKDKLYILAESLKTTQGQLVEEVSRLMVSLSKILFVLVANASTDYDKRKPRELIYKFMHIPANFIYHAGKSEVHGGFESLVDAIVRIGLMAYQQGDDEIAKKSIELVSRTAASAAEETVCSYGNIHAPRIMEKACYIGILALKDSKPDLLKYTKEQIGSFEATLGAHQEQMIGAFSLEGAVKKAAELMSHQIMGIRDEKMKIHSEFELVVPGNEAQKAFLQMVEIIDIDRFTKEIWNTWQTPSPLDAEVEKEMAKKKKKQAKAKTNKKSAAKAKPKKKPAAKAKPKKKPKKKPT